MADMLQPYVVDLVGGLVLNKSMFEMQPGEALELTNFEPGLCLLNVLFVAFSVFLMFITLVFNV